MSFKEIDFAEVPGAREARDAEVAACIEQSSDIPAALKPELLKHTGRFVYSELKRSDPDVHHQLGQIGSKKWAIRSSELKLVSALSPTTLALATVLAGAVGNPVVFAVGLLMTAVELALRLRQKGVSLCDEQYRVLTVLKEVGPCSEETLLQSINGLDISSATALAYDRLKEILHELSGIRAVDGSVEALVVKANDGLWSTNGV